ncbi:hypothetical protein Y032_0008g214 [Ancylostoma ceylanicum]|uniref:Secreted protein n=1 Tax=Ancylostoma ceylanicum TaxID=53326 RepID=A0A016VJQ2_9BILA|nr:hypothetical protein Y032_0008g214 [Ancylostoma ceylanicum]
MGTTRGGGGARLLFVILSFRCFTLDLIRSVPLPPHPMFNPLLGTVTAGLRCTLYRPGSLKGWVISYP